MTANTLDSAARAGKPVRLRRRRYSEATLATAYLLPLLLCLAAFFIGPIAFSIWTAFQADGTSDKGGKFVAFDNFRDLLADPSIQYSTWTTILFTVGTVVATYVIGLLCALLLTRRFHGRSLIGALLVVPWTMPLVVVAVVWGWLLDYQFGAINYILSLVGLAPQPVGFLTDPNWALWSVGAAQVWRMFPLAMITLLAAMRGIPTELYEAARVDGANEWQCFRAITVPAIASTSSALLLLIGIWSFGRVFSTIYVMTGGGPAEATETLVIRTYIEAFANFHLERASALGVLILVASIVLTLAYLRMSRNED